MKDPKTEKAVVTPEPAVQRAVYAVPQLAFAHAYSTPSLNPFTELKDLGRKLLQTGPA